MTEEPARLSSVANALRLLTVFSDDEYELGISQLAAKLGLAKSTVHRLATTLLVAGMLEQNTETGKYRLGLAVFQLGALVRRKLDISAAAKPCLMRLREQTDETVQLAVPGQGRPGQGGVMYVNFLESRHAIRMGSRIGLTLPLHCTAEGKALLAFGLAEEAPPTPNQAADLAAIRARGFAIDDEECEPGMRSIAAPIFDESGAAIAAVGIAGPAQRLSRPILEGFAPNLLEAAEAISQRVGGRMPAQGLRRHA